MKRKKKYVAVSNYDAAEKNLEGYPEVFADIFNALVYEGNLVVKVENLYPAATETLYKGVERKLRKQFEDIGKCEVREGKCRILYLLANQTDIDRKMLLRKEGYVGGAYREQYDGKVPDQCPVMEIVLYWGKARWRGARTIRGMFRNKELEPQAWKYIDNAKLHVFEMRYLPRKVRERFRSDMRFVVEYLADKESLEKMDQEVVHLEALLDLLRELSGDDRYQNFLEYLQSTDQLVQKKEGGRWKMCELMDKYWEGGKREGIEQGIEQGIETGLVASIRNLKANLKFTTEQAMKALNIPESQFEHYAGLV